eukprot:233303-Prorocentrum_minimum.AAC.1
MATATVAMALTVIGSVAIIPLLQFDASALVVHLCALFSPVAFALAMNVTARAGAARRTQSQSQSQVQLQLQFALACAEAAKVGLRWGVNFASVTAGLTVT